MEHPEPKVLIVGAGAIGASLASWLAPFHRQLFITDVAKVRNAVKTRGIVVYRIDDPVKSRETVRIRVIDQLQDLADADIVVLAVKNYSLAAVAQQIHGQYGNRPIVVSLANGVDNQHILPKFFSRVIYGVVGYNAVRDAEFEVGYQKKGPLVIGTPNDSLQNELLMVRNLLNQACKTLISHRLQDAVHSKIVTNLANALDTLVGRGFAPVSDFGVYQHLLSNIWWEGVQVIQAAGYYEYKIDGLPTFLQIRLARLMPGWIARPLFKRKLKSLIMTSMTQDVFLRHTQSTELESLTGYIVRLAAEHHVAVPYNDAIYRLARKYFRPGFVPMRCEDVLAEVEREKHIAHQGAGAMP